MRIQDALFHVSVGAARERVAETLADVVAPARPPTRSSQLTETDAGRRGRGAAGQPDRSATGSRARRAGAGPT